MKRARLAEFGIVLVLGSFISLASSISARGDDRSSTLALLGLLDKDTAHAALIAVELKQARDALERATRMRDANDENHAELANGLAAEWARVARDLVRAMEAEELATRTRLAANDAGARADRERALLEEGIARQGRLRAELEKLTHERQSKGILERTSRTSADAGGGP